MREVIFLLLVSLLCVAPAIAQSPTATINGIVLDPSGAAIAGAQVVIVNDATGVQYTTKTNSEGIYVAPNLPPGPYRIQVSNSGFKTIIKPDIVIHVQDALAINFTLPIGAASEIVTVQGGAPLVNTESAAVSTVIDRTFVENMPLNGRSLQDLILLTPGIVTNTPQRPSTIGLGGEFSVNGQRTESNYYSVDGVSANIGVSASFINAPSASGSLPASTALGTTQALVPLDALEEFRVQTSSYSAEYGRNPGGQFSFVTRSGTNQWHGLAFDYLRNDIFDANDWFNDYLHQAKSALRQNDFGGTLGGPFEIPHVYDGKDKTFFFFSYEGLRLVQPHSASVTQVPTPALRQAAPGDLQSALSAFPLPFCPKSVPNCVEDLGNGLGDFVGTWSDPSSINSYSIRLDEVVTKNLRVFFHYADTPSSGTNRNPLTPSMDLRIGFTARTYTLGAFASLSNRLGNNFRLNYSSNESSVLTRLDGFGGATPANFFALQGLPTTSFDPAVVIGLFFGPYAPQISQQTSRGEQRQWNFVDTVSVSLGRHQLDLGVDYRRLTPKVFPVNPEAFYGYFGEGSVQANSANFVFAKTQSSAFPVYANFSAFAQDRWRLTPRFSLSLGLRWEVNPAPGAADGDLPYTTGGGSLSTLALARRGTPLWRTSWYNFAPRLGAAYVFRRINGFETVLRAGGGAFYDTGQQNGSDGYAGPGFSATANISGASFPLPAAQITPAIVNPPVAPYTNTQVYAFPWHLELPYTLQWNASIQQALGKDQALTISYVGASGRKLLEQNEINVGLFNPNFGFVSFLQNGLTSNYNALQLQFQRHLSRGLQVLAGYSWAHSIDYGSFNAVLPYQRGNSDLDVRHNFSSALSYDLPNHFRKAAARLLLNQWSLDDRFSARTGFPVTLDGQAVVDPVTGQSFNGGLNLVPGKPIYVYGSECAQVFGSACPGGWAVNPNAFCDPSAGVCPGTIAPRNFVRGFGAWQMDIAVRRQFLIHENLRIQFRAEAFNVFNHPNFGTINPQFGQATFGQATATLASSLGVLSPLYQAGGPRSVQVALKLIF